MIKDEVRLVIDTGVFIPCGDKSEDLISSIKKFGNELPNLVERVDFVILLSTEILKEYSLIRSKIKEENCHPLPKFHASFIRNLDRIQRLKESKKCIKRMLDKYTFHVIESSKIDIANLNKFVNDPKDEKFLKLALTEASKSIVFLLSVDSASLLRLRINSSHYEELYNEFPMAKNIKVMMPGEFVDFITNYGSSL